MARKDLVYSAAALGVAALAGGLLVRQNGSRSAMDDAPLRSARRNKLRGFTLTGKTVTVSKPGREELFAFWRDFTNLPSFMENLDAVAMEGGKRSRWTIKAPAGSTVELVTEITEETQGRLIAWKSTPESDVETSGRVTFEDAPGDRGVYVALEIEYRPPMGAAGQAVAKLLQREPTIQARRDLRRFKMLMETGEIATAANRIELEEAA